MAILKRTIRRKRKDEKASFLGLTIPKEMADYLSLFSLAKGITKSSVIKALLQNWIHKMKEDFVENDLVKIIGFRSFNSWKNPNVPRNFRTAGCCANPVAKRINFNTFKSSLKIELDYKGLSDYSDGIIKLIEDEKRKDEGNSIT